MQVIHNVRDNLTDTSTTDDIEVMAVAAASKAEEFARSDSASQKKRMLNMESPVPAKVQKQMEDKQEEEQQQQQQQQQEQQEQEEQEEQEDPVMTDEEEKNEPVVTEDEERGIPTPTRVPTETESDEDMFSKPIKRQFGTQQQTDQINEIFDSEK